MTESIQMTLEQYSQEPNDVVLYHIQCILNLNIPFEATWVYILRTNRTGYDNEIYVGQSNSVLNRMRVHRKERYPNLELIALRGPYTPKGAIEEESHTIRSFADKGVCLANGGARGKAMRKEQ